MLSFNMLMACMGWIRNDISAVDYVTLIDLI